MRLFASSVTVTEVDEVLEWAVCQLPPVRLVLLSTS